MTQQEWTETIITELRDAGFSVSIYQGFPLVETPRTFAEKKRFLNFKYSTSIVKRIHAEGVLITPR